MLAVHRMHVHLAFVGRTRVHERFEYGLVGVLKLHIFAHEGYVHFGLGALELVEEVVPGAHVRLREVVNLEMAHHELVEVFLMHVQRHLVDAPCVDGLYHVSGLHVAEHRDLLADFRGQGVLGAADDDVRLHSRLLEHLHRMLCGLCLELLGGAEVGHERQVDGQAVLLGQLPLQLAHGLDEGLRFHVAYGSAYLCDYHVVFAGLAEQHHAALDFVGDMGDDLDGLAEVCAFALLGDDGVVYLSGRHVVRLGRVDSEEALVVSEVEVGLGSVLGHVALAVLVGVEGAGVDIDVGVEFLDCYAQASCLKEFCEGCGDYALAQR